MNAFPRISLLLYVKWTYSRLRKFNIQNWRIEYKNNFGLRVHVWEYRDCRILLYLFFPFFPVIWNRKFKNKFLRHYCKALWICETLKTTNRNGGRKIESREKKFTHETFHPLLKPERKNLKTNFIWVCWMRFDRNFF